jgi:uncharacterized protein (DUF1697 family)
MPVKTFIALLRGINVGGHNRILMPELRELAAALGWADVQSYLQSGNLVFRAGSSPQQLAVELERAIDTRFGLPVPVVIREATEWTGYVAGNPFTGATASEPGLVMLAVSKDPPTEGAAAELQTRATQGERVRQVGDAVWIHYAGGAGRSRLSPGLLDRVVGSAVTTRNWRTVSALATMAVMPPPTEAAS